MLISAEQTPTTQIALISDIHGNGVALDAVLREIAEYPVDQVICLGDALQGGSQPARVVELLKDIGCPVIMGNADSFLLTGETAEGGSDALNEIRQWTLDQLGDEGLQFIRSFLPTLEIELKGGDDKKLLCFHGSPQSFDDVLLPDTSDEAFFEALAASSASHFSGGHTHYQWMKKLVDRVYFNPGSVGLAYNRLLARESFYVYPLAEYAVLSTSTTGTNIEFRHMLLDPDELAQAALSSGRPHANLEADRYRRPAPEVNAKRN